jgi:hypothetical protein
MMVAFRYDNDAVGSLYYSREIPSLLRGLRVSKLLGRSGVISFESNGLFVIVRGAGLISNSTNIAKASWSVLKSEKELVVLPILGFFSTVLVMGVFGGLAFITIGQTTTAGTTEYDATPLTYAIGVLAYFAATTTGMFFLAALVSGAHQRLTVGEATLGS